MNDRSSMQELVVVFAGIEDGSFENFVNRIRNNKLQFDENNLELSYYSKGNKYELKYDSNFSVNGKDMNTNYRRFDSPYAESDKKAETIKIKMNDESLFLDFENLVREY